MATNETASTGNIDFLDCPDAGISDAEICIVPLPFEGTVSYGSGTAAGPASIIVASAQVELWDDELNYDLKNLRYFTAPAIRPEPNEAADAYLRRVEVGVRELSGNGRLVIGIGGEHSLTPPLVYAAFRNNSDLNGLTVVQIDAHTDLRETYEGTPQSHACATRRLAERGARVIAIGVRAISQPESAFEKSVSLVEIYRAQALAENSGVEQTLLSRLRELHGDVYLTVDIDGLDPSMCPGTGTPEPGGLSWWQTLRILRAILLENRSRNLIGCDLVETVPQPNTQINEFTAARLLAKMIAYAKVPVE